MTRKMAYVGSAYLITLFFASFFHFEVLIIAGLFIMAAAFAVFALRGGTTAFVCMLTAATAMFTYAVADAVLYTPLVSYSGKTVTISGKVESFSYSGSDMSSYTINGKIDGGPAGSFNIFADDLGCNYGDVITARGVVEKPKNSYLFPAEDYYKAGGVFLEMAFPSEISIFKADGFSLRRTILQYRDYLYEKIVTILPEREGAALLAMLCGDRTRLDDDTRIALYRSGIGHIMSVSGVHLTIIAAMVLWTLERLRINKWLRFAVLEVAIVCFVIFAGLANSVLRSAVMLTCVYGAALFRRRADSFSSLGVSVIALTLLSPFAVRDASFLLSVTGVFGIAVLAPKVSKAVKRRGILGKLGRSLVTSLCVTFVVFPVSFLFFDEISIISPIANLLLIPICTAALFCGFIVMLTGGVTLIAFPLLLFAGLCCKAVLAVCDFVGRLRFTYIPTGYNFLAFGAAALLCAVVASFVIFRRKDAVVFMVALAVPTMLIAAIFYSTMNRNVLTIAVIGDSTSSTLIVHDGKSACAFDLKSGKNTPRVVQKYLTKLGIENIGVIGMSSGGEQLATAYEKRLSFCDVGEVIATEDCYLDSAFGKAVTKADDGAEIIMGSYKVILSDDNTAEIRYGDLSFLAIGKDADYSSYSGKAYSAVCVYNGTQAPPVQSGYALFLDEKAGKQAPVVSECGFLITGTPSGKVKIRGITNGSRQ